MRPLLLILALATSAAPLAAQGSGWVTPGGVADTIPPPQPTADSPSETPGFVPSDGGNPASGGGVVLGGGVTGTSAGAGAIDQDELGDWSYWWYFNREPLLDLRARFEERGGPLARPSADELAAGALPTLFALARAEHQDNVRATAGIALGRLPLESASNVSAVTEVLRALSRTSDPQLREDALLALGLQGGYPALETLAATAASGQDARKFFGARPSMRQRVFATYALGVMGSEAPHAGVRRLIVERLWPLAMDGGEERELRIAVVNALGLAGLPPTEPDAAEAPDAAPRTLEALTAGLWELHIVERDVFVRAHLPVAVARLASGGPDALRARYATAFRERLAQRGGARTQEQHGLVIGLGILGSAWGREADIELRAALRELALESSDAHTRHLAVMALTRATVHSGASLPPPPVQAELERFLVDAFEDASSEDRAWLALAAGTLGAHLARPPGGQPPAALSDELRALLRDVLREGESATTLCAIALALGLSEDTASAPVLVTLLDEAKNPQVRGYSALALGLIGHAPARPAIEAQLLAARYDPVSLEHTALGLALLDRARATQALLALLATARNGRDAAPLAAVLGRVADAGALEPLITLASSDDLSLQARANLALALGLIADLRAPSWRAALATDVNYFAWTPTLVDEAGMGVLNIF